ncbi:glycosyltransferase family 4 protein [Caenispirillum salinarum]|uniref:MraY family glycosyltransferase n=1 Tax=Caenispirillum salinarum TaxID=859058 RepID=UPI00384C724F
MTDAFALPLFAVTACASVFLTGSVLAWLRLRQILDRPNERSSHALPTPRGGGLAVVPLVVGMWTLALAAGAPAPLGAPWVTVSILAAAVVLAAVSWIDDRRPLPPLPRLAMQAAAVALGITLLPAEALVLGGAVPLWLDHTLAGLGWLWFVNLYNFMDGIDGITGVETGSIGGGLALLALVGLVPEGFLVPGIVLMAAAMGFLLWNWHPARLFMGDVGSVPLGYAVGFLLIALAATGHLAAAVILALYYLVDATFTLLRRTARGEKPWTPHRSHFYQLATRGGVGHDIASTAVALLNIGLIGCAIAAASGYIPIALTGALILVSLVCGGFLLTWIRAGRP